MARRGAKLGTSVLDLDVDDSRFDSGLKSAEQKASSWTQRVGNKLKSVTDGLGSGIKGGIAAGLGFASGLGVVHAASAAVETVANYLGDSVRMASDLNEEISKSGIVFGASAGEVQKFADSAAAIGLSTQEALGAAGAFGNMFNTIGLAQDQSAAMAVTMVKLASDMSAFNNQDPSEMLDKLRSGLAGEAEPLRQLGVLLSESAVKTYAYAHGIAAAGTQLTEAQKVQARYGLILEQTAIQQGNFALTSKDMAQTTRANDAAWANIQTRIGKGLLPVFEALGWVFGHVVLPALELLVNGLGAVGDAVGAIGTAVLDMSLNFGDMGDRVHAVADRLGVDFQTVKDKVRDAMMQSGMSFDDALAAAVKALDGIPDHVKTTGSRSAKALKGAAAEVAAGAETGIVDPIVAKMEEARKQAIAESKAIPGDIAKALIAGQKDVESGMTELTDLMENSLSDAAKVARLKGILASKELAAGLVDERADVRASALQLKTDAEEQLQLLESGAADAAVNAGTTFAEQLRLQSSAAAAAAQGVAARAHAEMHFDASDAGASSAQTFIDGLRATLTSAVTIRSVHLSLEHLKAITLGGSLPKGGPFAHPETGGLSIGETWMAAIADAIDGSLRAVQARVGSVEDAMRLGPAVPTIGLPSMPGVEALANAHGGFMGTTLGDASHVEYHNHWELHVEGQNRVADTKRAALDELERMSTTWG